MPQALTYPTLIGHRIVECTNEERERLIQSLTPAKELVLTLEQRVKRIELTLGISD